MKYKAKLYELDYLRSWAFLAVLFQHVWGSVARYYMDSQTQLFIGISFTLGKFAVPLFVFLSGMVFFYNYYDKLNYLSFLKKRGVEIFIPYLFWTAFYLLEHKPKTQILDPEWWIVYLRSLVWGSGKYHLWYIVMLAQLILVTPLIFKAYAWCENKIKKSRYLGGGKGLLILMGGLSIAYLLFVTKYYEWFCHTPWEWLNIRLMKSFSLNALSYLIYFLWGGVVARNYESFKAFIVKSFYWLGLATVLLYAYITQRALQEGYQEGKIQLNVFGSLNVRFYLWTMVSIFFLYRIALYLTEQYKKSKQVRNLPPLIALMSNYSYWIYLVHPFGLSTASIVLRDFSIPSGIVYSLLLLTLGFLVSVPLGFISSTIYRKLINLNLRKSSKFI
ncbi:MAG: acyltransferase [Vallitaleaceae bacterium]|nr:acyltransferase [Vallitaleaceae bacterium]